MRLSLLPAGFNNIDRVERGQALYRLWIGPFIFLVVLPLHFFGLVNNTKIALISIAGYSVLGVVWIYFISIVKTSPTFRRVLIIFLDLISYSIGLSLAGEIYALLIWVPLSISMGNGLRYNANFGFLSAIVSGVCVTVALTLSPFWRSIPLVSVGFVLTITIIPVYAFLLSRNIAKHKLAREQRAAELERAIKLDALTGAFNRTGFSLELENLFEQTQCHGALGAVLVIDLDGFKRINDEAGHAIGDLILKEVTQHMQKCLRVSDSVARLGGDEFAIALRSLQSSEDAHRLADKVIRLITEIAVPRYPQLHVSASIGICLLPDPNIHTISDALELADMRMYAAKRAGKGRANSGNIERGLFVE
ncbi:MAG: GGDEF domain-containing protein [Agitococcus sp.]|nr:GGDEF domain-containing protein [Agitococcus sp.]MDO9178659.1 GGDEF domain-containing protein [Agitococcus sp.]